MHQSFVTPDPVGPAIAGKEPSLDLSIIAAVLWNGGAFDSMAKNGQSNFTFNAGFEQGFDHKTVPTVQGIYLGFAKGKVNIPLLPSPTGAVVTNDWCIKHIWMAFGKLFW